MPLYCDLGNTRIKWRNGSEAGSIGYDNLAEDIPKLFSTGKATDGVVFASVVKDQRRLSFIREVRVFAPKISECVVTSSALGVQCAYADVTRLGIDRWLAVIAAWERSSEALMVVDLGTAATFDFVDKNGIHLGGYIVPGLKLGIEGLLRGTNNVIVDMDLLRSANRLPGTNTNEAVYHGALAAITSTIESAFHRHQSQYPEAKLLLTGGDAELVANHLECHYQVDGNLVFEGMQLLHEHNLAIELAI